MARTKTVKSSDTRRRTVKGTTSRSSAMLRASLLLVLPIVALIAALVRHVEPHTGPVPDWAPTTERAEH